MTNKMFIHYETDGKITSFTHEHEVFLNARKEAGEPIIEVSEQFDYKMYKVDLATMEIIPRTPEEIAADQPAPTEIPIYIPPTPVAEIPS